MEGADCAVTHASFCALVSLIDLYFLELSAEWWAMQGLNLRPLPCEGSALPLS